MRRAIVSLTTAILLACTAVPAVAALAAYMRVQGQIQGNIRGGVTQKGREGSMEVIHAIQEIVSPRDPTTGQATGKRQHKPLTIRMPLDEAAPKLYQALVTNETLTSVEIKFYAQDQIGRETNHYTILLTNAQLASIETVLPDTKTAATATYPLYLEVSFTYQKIEWTWTDGGITAQDTWGAGPL